MGKDADERRRQDKILFGVYVPVMKGGKDAAYVIMEEETGSKSWSALSTQDRAKVLKALKEETGITPDHNKAAVDKGQFKNPIPDPPVDNRQSDQQKATINKVRNYLGWSEKGLDGFCAKRFDEKPVRWLDGRQAHSLLYLLLKIAARKLKAANPTMNLKEYEWIDKVKAELDIHSFKKAV